MNNKLFTTLTIAFLFLSAIVFAQAPQAFSYQAIAANANGTPVANGTVAVRISVLDNSATGTVLYTETHSKQTNAQGLFNLNIGQGSPTTGTFSGINWGQNAKYVKVELDPAGGTNYVNVGTNQLMSVPYALFADNVNPGSIGSAIGATTIEGKGNMLVTYTSSNAYAYHQSGTSSNNGWWNAQSLSGQVLGAASSKNAIVVYTATNAYAFHRSGTSSNDGWWVSQSLSGTPIGICASDSQIVVYTSSNAYAFSKSGTSSNNGWWNAQSLSGTVKSATASVNAVVVYTSSSAYAYHQSGTSSNSGWWDEQSISGTVSGARASSNQIIVYTSANAYAFSKSGTSSNNGWWNAQSLSGTSIGAINSK